MAENRRIVQCVRLSSISSHTHCDSRHKQCKIADVELNMQSFPLLWWIPNDAINENEKKNARKIEERPPHSDILRCNCVTFFHFHLCVVIRHLTSAIGRPLPPTMMTTQTKNNGSNEIGCRRWNLCSCKSSACNSILSESPIKITFDGTKQFHKQPNAFDDGASETAIRVIEKKKKNEKRKELRKH